jgi:hypothetical protein
LGELKLCKRFENNRRKAGGHLKYPFYSVAAKAIVKVLHVGASREAAQVFDVDRLVVPEGYI